MSDAVVKHAFQSAAVDLAVAGQLGPSEWNAALLFSGGTAAEILTRDPASATGAAWAPVAAPAWSAITGTPTTLAGYGIATPIAAADGGTGIAGYVIGDLLVASGAAALSPLAAVATGRVLASGGVGAAPAWSGSPTLADLTLANPSGMQAGWFNYAAWGDSLTGGTGGTPYPTTLATLTGQTVYNGGVGGETSTQIATRFLADTARLKHLALLWAGRNDFITPATVKANIAAMIAALPTPKRFLVLSVLNADQAVEWSGGANYATLVQLNADLAALYPNNYLDIRATLVAAYNAGIPQDVIDHGHDVSPSSLRSDLVHLNTTGYTLVANTVKAWLDSHDTTPHIAARLADLVTTCATPPTLASTAALRWGSSGTTAADVGLVRVFANTLGVQNGTTNQSLEVFESFIDASNFGKLRIVSRGATDFAIYTDRSGSVAARHLSFGAAGALQWRINTAGHLLALTDNSFDIGVAGATRPRNIFVGSSVVNKTKAGTPTDADVTNPADGMLVVDTTASKIWVRTGGAWKGVAVA